MQARKKISLVWRSVFSIIVLTAILDRVGLFSGTTQLQTILSFTSISGIYVLFITLITLYGSITYREKESVIITKARTIGVMMILITGLLYHFILLPEKLAENQHYQVFSYGNIGAHYITPAGMLVDWLLFVEKGKISKWEPLICSGIPFFYFVVFSIYGYFGAAIPGKDTSYAYFFMDWERLGIARVVMWVGILLLCILCLTYFLYFIDCVLAGKKRIHTRDGGSKPL